MSLSNKLAYASIIIGVLGIFLTVMLGSGSTQEPTENNVLQTTSGDKSPAVNSSGSVRMKIR